jgi:UDP-glucose 4-epimerase
MLTEKFDVVNHHAAHMELRVSVEKPLLDANTNVLGSIRVLQSAVKSRVQHILLASTCAVLGELKYFPADEHHETLPISPYGCSKLAMEQYANYYRAVHGMSITTLRYTNVYGPRQNPNGESGVIAIFLQKFLEDKEAVIHGHGNQVRDYVYVKDIARANVAALESRLNDTYFVCSDNQETVNDIVSRLKDYLKHRVKVSHGPPKSGDADRISCSPVKFFNDTGWQSKVDLSEGLKETIDWFAKKNNDAPK